MQKDLAETEKPPVAPYAVVPIERSLTGSLKKGLFSAKLVYRFEVLAAEGHVRVPVLDAEASLGDVRLNGQRTSLQKEGALYSVGVDRPGVFRLEAEMFWGKEQDRFARRLQLRLPEAGATRLSVLIPEADIEAKLTSGVVTRSERRPGATLVEGHLDPTGNLDLAWNRKLTHRTQGQVRWEAKEYTVFTVHEAIIQGVAAFDLAVLSGEADRVDLRLPAEIEVLRVEGDAVLQWHTDAKNGGVLAVLFRYLVEKGTRVTVHFQYPADPRQTVPLRMPLGPAGVAVVGALGVQGPAGLDVKPVGLPAGEEGEAAQRDLPAELTELTRNPLLFGLTFATAPELGLAITRHREVENLTTTIIDNLQASTVLNEDGAEVTKVKLRMRNNTQQYLRVALPRGAELTHSLIDGQPIRPATAIDAGREILLFPLRQSEKLAAGQERFHEVGEGETLSDIANFYYSDPNEWQSLIEANPGEVYDAGDLYVGQQLRIPAKKGATVQESSFVVELAFKREHSPLGFAGSAAVILPEVDVDTVEVTWHLYLPHAIEPLLFSGNLVQYSAIRYDPFRRVRDFLRDALWMRDAWAGGYSNVLRQRKMIFKSETTRESTGKMILSSFPLVGERYRFKHILIGKETPRLSFTFVDRELLPPLRWGALLAAFGLGLWLLLGRRDRRTWMVAAATLVLLLIVSYFVLGMHRRIIWGFDLALLVVILRLRLPAAWAALLPLLREPWRLVSLVTLVNFVWIVASCIVLWLVLAFPLLLSSIAAAVMLVGWYRLTHAAAREEVRHA
jgi:hypothetical protein